MPLQPKECELIAHIAGALATPFAVQTVELLRQGPQPEQALAAACGASLRQWQAAGQALRGAGLAQPAAGASWQLSPFGIYAARTLFGRLFAAACDCEQAGEKK